MSKKQRLLALCVLLVVVVGALVWYHIPVKTAASMELLISDILWVPIIQFGSGYEIENVSLQFTSDDYASGLWSNYKLT